MFKTTIIAVSALCFAGSVYAAEVPIESSPSDEDFSTWSTEPLPNEAFNAGNNYLLLFDELTGKMVYGLFAGSQCTKPDTFKSSLCSFFCRDMEMDCLKVKDTVIHDIGPAIRGKWVSTMPGAVTNTEDFVSIPAGGIHGITAHIWEAGLWRQLGDELRKHEKIKLFETVSPAYRTHIVTAGKLSDPYYYAEVSRKTYDRLQKYKSIAKYRPYTAYEVYNIDDVEYRRHSVQLSEENGRLKTHGPDHDFEMLLDRQCGLLAVFLEYADTKEPRDLDILKIATRTDPDSLLAVPWDYWSSGEYLKDVDGEKVLRANQTTLQRLDKKAETLMKQNPKMLTVFTIRRDLVYGTVRPIWELEIWAELGRCIQESKKACILAFNDEDIKDLKQPEISQTYLVVTPPTLRGDGSSA